MLTASTISSSNADTEQRRRLYEQDYDEIVSALRAAWENMPGTE